MLPRKVTLEQVESKIKHITFSKLGEKTTLCFAVLENGFEVVATSGCVDPAEYSEELGAKFSRQRLVDEVWKLEGYVLQQKKFEGTHAEQSIAELSENKLP